MSKASEYCKLVGECKKRREEKVAAIAISDPMPEMGKTMRWFGGILYSLEPSAKKPYTPKLVLRYIGKHSSGHHKMLHATRALELADWLNDLFREEAK